MTVYNEWMKRNEVDPKDASKSIEVKYIGGTIFTPESHKHMSTWQMMGMTGHNPSKRVRKSSLFKPQKMSSQLENMLYPDNPKFLDAKVDINVPKSALYNSGFHQTPAPAPVAVAGGGGGSV